MARVAAPDPSRFVTADNDNAACATSEDLRHALTHDGLSLFYQPIVELETAAVAGFEVLLHWFHPTEGQLGPERIATLAQEAMVAGLLATAVLTQAARATARWSGYGFVAIRFSAEQLGEPGLVQDLAQTLHRTGLPPARLMVELAGGAASVDIRRTSKALAQLRVAGIAIAFDGFGHGPSDPAIMDAGAFDMLKLHRTVASSAPGQLAGLQRSATRLARSMKMAVVATGLDTAEQVRMARAAGCTHGQGDLLGRPLPMPVLGCLSAM